MTYKTAFVYPRGAVFRPYRDCVLTAHRVPPLKRWAIVVLSLPGRRDPLNPYLRVQRLTRLPAIRDHTSNTSLLNPIQAINQSVDDHANQD